MRSERIDVAAAAIANARAGRRGAPPISNVLAILPANLVEEVREDAKAVLAALGEDVTEGLLKSAQDQAAKGDRLRVAAMAYVAWHGSSHQRGCPGDDTCDCKGRAVDVAMNAALGEEVCANGGEHLHGWWSLSYAQYLTLPRSVMQSMPDAWQGAMFILLEQLDDTIDWRPKGLSCYRVELRQIVERPGSSRETWGKKLEDPLEEYNRGRRRIPHKEGA